MNRIKIAALAALLLATGVAARQPVATQSQNDGFIVIVNPTNPVSTIAPDQLSKLFLKKATKWSHGAPVVAVDLPEQSGVRAAFTRAVHKRSLDAVKSYWQQQIFSGREAPPPEKPSEQDVLAHVRSTPGGVGYVSPSASLQGVKQIVVR